MLNACPKCQRTFDSTEGAFCPQDATKLEPVEQVAIVRMPSDPFVGHVIAGRYEVRRVVADGGMGRVYEARQLAEQRRIAVKILHPQIAEDEVNIERFKREAETSRLLDHGHIVDVLDFDEEKPAPGRPAGAWYLVMEYLDGEELRALVDRVKVLPLARTIRIIAQTAIALDGAHARGYVHRDMKPDNIFLVRRPGGDHVKLLDFGSVKLTREGDRRVKLTAMGTTIGSPYYMSPEQAEGLPDVDHRTDVWALGAILFEMTVGQVPFSAPNGPQILFKIIGTAPPIPSFVNDAIAPQLDDVITRALTKKRDERYSSCGALADALGRAFGLTGDHVAWAAQSEDEIKSALRGQDAVRAAQTAAPKAAGIAFPMVSAQKPAAAPPPPPATRSPSADPGLAVPEDYSPIKKPAIPIYAVIAGVVLLVGIVTVFALR